MLGPHDPDYWTKFFVVALALCITVVVLAVYHATFDPKGPNLMDDPWIQHQIEEASKPWPQKAK